MNLLWGSPPRSVDIEGVRYPVNYDFRTGVRVMAAFEAAELAAHEKQGVMLRLFYGKGLPPNAEKAARLALRFYNGGKREDGAHGGKATGRGERLFSWEKDAGLIYSAMQATHGLDLAGQTDLHWWVFMALFMDLKEDCLFCRLVDLRQRKKRGRLTAEERLWCAKNRELVELPRTRSREERAAVEDFVAGMAAKRAQAAGEEGYGE